MASSDDARIGADFIEAQNGARYLACNRKRHSVAMWAYASVVFVHLICNHLGAHKNMRAQKPF
jgi:hypothetical protein